MKEEEKRSSLRSQLASGPSSPPQAATTQPISLVDLFALALACRAVELLGEPFHSTLFTAAPTNQTHFIHLIYCLLSFKSFIPFLLFVFSLSPSVLSLLAEHWLAHQPITAQAAQEGRERELFNFALLVGCSSCFLFFAEHWRVPRP